MSFEDRLQSKEVYSEFGITPKDEKKAPNWRWNSEQISVDGARIHKVIGAIIPETVTSRISAGASYIIEHLFGKAELDEDPLMPSSKNPYVSKTRFPLSAEEVKEMECNLVEKVHR